MDVRPKQVPAACTGQPSHAGYWTQGHFRHWQTELVSEEGSSDPLKELLPSTQETYGPEDHSATGI
jgi:hypothetical protein